MRSNIRQLSCRDGKGFAGSVIKHKAQPDGVQAALRSNDGPDQNVYAALTVTRLSSFSLPPVPPPAYQESMKSGVNL